MFDRDTGSRKWNTSVRWGRTSNPSSQDECLSIALLACRAG